MNATVNFAQTSKEGNILDGYNTTYNSNNSLTPEFKLTSFEKRNNLDEPINIKTKAEERSVIQISFRTQDPNIRPAQSRICFKNYSWSMIHDSLCFQNPPIRSIYRKNWQSVRFLRPSPSIRKPIHPPNLAIYSGIPISRTLGFTNLPTFRTKPCFPWICFTQAL